MFTSRMLHVRCSPGISKSKVQCTCLYTTLHAQEVLKALAQNRIGKENAAVEFSKTDLIQRTWPRLRSIATLWILALTIPISVWGGVLLVLAHLLKGGRLVGWSSNPSNKTRKGYHPTAIVTGMLLHDPSLIGFEYCLCNSQFQYLLCNSHNDCGQQCLPAKPSSIHRNCMFQSTVI